MANAATAGTPNTFSWGKAITAGLAGVVASVVAGVVYALVFNAILGPAITPNPAGELAPVSVMFYAIAAAVFTLIGAVIFVLMMRFGGENAIRNFVIVGVVGLVVSFGTVFQPGIEMADRIQLAVAHIVCAAAAIPAMVLTYQRR